MTTTQIPDQDWIMERIHELDPKAHPEFRIYVVDYYMSTSVEISEGPVLISAYGNGSTPAACIYDTWARWTSLPRGHVLVTGAYTDHRAEHRWNEYEGKWATVKRMTDART